MRPARARRWSGCSPRRSRGGSRGCYLLSQVRRWRSAVSPASAAGLISAANSVRPSRTLRSINSSRLNAWTRTVVPRARRASSVSSVPLPTLMPSTAMTTSPAESPAMNFVLIQLPEANKQVYE